MRDDRFAGLGFDDMDEFDEETGARIEGDVNLEAFDVPLREWIAQGRTRNAIKRRFEKFLREHRVTRRDGSLAAVTYPPRFYCSLFILLSLSLSLSQSYLNYSFTHNIFFSPSLSFFFLFFLKYIYLYSFIQCFLNAYLGSRPCVHKIVIP